MLDFLLTCLKMYCQLTETSSEDFITFANNRCKLQIVPSGNETNAELVPAIMNLWIKASLPQTTDKRVAQMTKELLNKLKSIQSQPKDRLQSPAHLKKLEGFKQDLSTLFDITSCKCLFDLSAPVHNGKVTCIHPFDKQIPERELPFILDQRKQRRMVIGNVDTAVTAHNMQRAKNVVRKTHCKQCLQPLVTMMQVCPSVCP